MIGFLAHNVWWIVGVAAIAACCVWPAIAWKLRWPLAVAAVAILAATFWMDASALRLQLAQRDAADSHALASAEHRARLGEQAATRALANNTTTYLRGKEDAKKEFDALGTGVVTGAVVVRHRLQCPPVARVPGAAAAAGGSDATAYTGLTDADALAALGIAHDGDDAIRALTLAQATINAYIAQFGAPPEPAP